MDADSLGLSNWRKSRGITLEDIAASTKLGVSQLRAIETGDFRKLPGGIYNISYIKQYARAIEFDEAEILAYYQESCHAGSKESRDGARTGLSRLLWQN